MKKDLELLLSKRYPAIFADYLSPPQDGSASLRFDCGDGWFDLIDALCERLQFKTDHNGAPQVHAVQVKEKLGQLRFYPSTYSPAQWGMVEMAQAMSSRICEECGRPGLLLVSVATRMTRCTEHAPKDAIALDAFETAREASTLG